MTLVNKLRKVHEREPREDDTQIEALESISGEIVKEIFFNYSKILLSKGKVYLADAIWGASTSGDMDRIQSEISRKVSPQINRILSIAAGQGNHSKQSVLLTYLVKAYVVMKLYYMIESLKNNKNDRPVSSLSDFFQNETMLSNN